MMKHFGLLDFLSVIVPSSWWLFVEHDFRLLCRYIWYPALSTRPAQPETRRTWTWLGHDFLLVCHTEYLYLCVPKSIRTHKPYLKLCECVCIILNQMAFIDTNTFQEQHFTKGNVLSILLEIPFKIKTLILEFGHFLVINVCWSYL